MFVAEQHGETGLYHTFGQAGDALAGDLQVLLVLGLVQANFLGGEDVLDAAPARVEVVLGNAAVPRLGDQPLRADAAFGEVIADEGSEFAGAGFHGMQGHGRSMWPAWRVAHRHLVVVVGLGRRPGECCNHSLVRRCVQSSFRRTLATQHSTCRRRATPLQGPRLSAAPLMSGLGGGFRSRRRNATAVAGGRATVARPLQNQGRNSSESIIRGGRAW